MTAAVLLISINGGMDRMNIRKNKIIIELLNTLYDSLLIYTIIIALLFSIGESAYAIPSTVLLIVPLMSYYLEQHSKHISLFLLCHITAAFILYILPKQLTVKIIYVMFTVIVMIYHLYRRVKRKSSEQKIMSVVYLTVPTALQFYADWKAYSQLSRMIQIITLLCVIIYFTALYLFNFTEFFSIDMVNTNINLHRIKRINHRIITGFICIISVIMTCAFSVPASKLLPALKSMIIFLVRILLSWIRPSDYEEKIETVEENTPNMEQFIPIEPSEPNHIWLIIQEILFILCVVVIILAFAALIIYGLYQLYKHFHTADANETDKREFISPFYKENRVKKLRKIHKTKLPHIFPDNNDKIRRCFYHLIISKYKDKVPANLTAEELLNLPVQSIGLLLSDGTDKFDPVLLKLYHKARYSHEMCSKEEVNMMKEIVRRMK